MISSPRHPLARRLRELRRAHGGDRCLLEGPDLVGEALAAGIGLDVVLATPEFLAGAAGRRLATSLPVPPEVVAPRLLEALADAAAPQGIVAVARLPRSGVAALPAHGDRFVYAEGVQDPGNLGAIARVAEATGASGLALAAGSAAPNHPRAQRSAAGSLLRLPVAVGATPEALDRHLGACTWIALVPRGGTSVWETPLEGRLVLALGAEGPGLSPAVAARCELALSVPVRPPVESLNVAVAAAVVLYEIVRRRDALAP